MAIEKMSVAAQDSAELVALYPSERVLPKSPSAAAGSIDTCQVGEPTCLARPDSGKAISKAGLVFNSEYNLKCPRDSQVTFIQV